MSAPDDDPELTLRGFPPPDALVVEIGTPKPPEWVPELRTKRAKLSHNDVATAAAVWLSGARWPVVIREVEWSIGRVDVLGVRPRTGRIAVIEAKATRSDLLADLRSGKALTGYRTHCDALWFAVPGDLAELAKERIPAGVGILVACPDPRYGCRFARAAAPIKGPPRPALVARALARVALSYTGREMQRIAYGGWDLDARRAAAFDDREPTT